MKLPNPSVRHIEELLAALKAKGSIQEGLEGFAKLVLADRPGWTALMGSIGRTMGQRESVGAVLALCLIDTLLEEQEIGDPE